VNHSMGVKSDGTVVAWGYNFYSQATVPSGLAGAIQAVGGNNHSAVLLHRPPLQWTHSTTEIRPTIRMRVSKGT
jgi:alpha-tubulin suppressor-like RCC1 family protein